MRLKAILLVFFLTLSWKASADDVNECVSAHEEGQIAKRDGKFDRAREAFASCQRETCPAAVRSRCTEFARELEAAQPTVVVIVRDPSGADAADARMSVDGAPLVDVSAMSVRLNPGSHTLHVEAPGLVPAEKTILVHEGVKNMQASFTLARPKVEPLPTSSESVDDRRPNTAAWVFAVGGGVALVSAGVLSAVGWVTHQNLKSSCGATGCSESRVEQLRVIWPASFVALGTGVVAGVVALVLFATHPHDARRSAWLQPAGTGLEF